MAHNPAHHALLLGRLRDAVLSGTRTADAPRSVISESWQRSLAANVNPDLHSAPVIYHADEVVDIREQHVLHPTLPMLRETLLGFGEEARQIMIICDDRGHILWCEGANDVRLTAENVGLGEGTRWSEDAAGTNAMGTALAVNGTVTVHSAEHLVRTYHGWTCAASPVRDPDTGRTIGVIDLSGPLETMHPAMVALVSASARLAESQLQVRLAQQDEALRARNMRHLIALRGEPGALLSPTGRVLAAEPHGLLPTRMDVTSDRMTLPDGREAVLEPLGEGFLLRVPRERRPNRLPRLTLSFLGMDPPVAVLDGREIPLSLRHAELLTALALQGGGLTAEQLALRLYGERGNPTTVRAEMHRLRAQLGEGVLHTRPYRLHAEVGGDFLAVRRALANGDVREAADRYRGSLLARSEAPVVRDERDDLAAGVRRGLLAGQDGDALWRFAQTDSGEHDTEVLEQLVKLLPSNDVRYALAATRLKRALQDG
ncbi:helix-turn-helix domain-containing protein [Lentzea sp. NBRC 105346]|uniref:GAF domain-containing protein n=1 Tax=Lentzea sp. NBRC 105346 TaxID=3032205 RepID=UPI0025524414|nr:helix-turn-helix domain-containing protein [Lentzea sp. NBRC 105346]